jgi:ABC-2 type transport system ATP-binding protein
MRQNRWCCAAWEWKVQVADDLVIETRDLTRIYKNAAAVDKLNLAVRRGEIFGLVGPDGAGKTTAIRLLAAILDPTSGQARVLGYDTVEQPEPIKQHIGYMAQRFNLYGDLSVLENLHFFADVFEVVGDVRRERIERLLHFARLTEFRDRRAAHLSGGMQKKLALACTLIHTPALIYLDEPTTGVDPVSRREFWDILAELYLQGITLVVSTPYMDEAERCSRVGLMYQGHMVVCDTPEHIKGMIAGELVVLRPSNLRRAREVVGNLPGILEMQTFGNQLRVLARDAGAVIGQAQLALAEQNIDVLDMRRSKLRMEEAFISLVRQQRAQPGSNESLKGAQDT